MNKNDYINGSLDFYIRHSHQSVAVMGDPLAAKEAVEKALRRAKKEWTVLDTLAMLSVDEVHTQRPGQCFFEAFFELQGIKSLPEVLIFDRFNHRPSAETYFIKSLLNRDRDCDEQTQKYLSGLKQIFLIIDRLDSPGVHNMDNNLQTCIASFVKLDS